MHYSAVGLKFYLFLRTQVTCQVLILTPVMVLNILISLTVTFETHAFVLSRPSPPMLIPWPGPQFTLCIFMLLHPVWIEIQSSPASRPRCHVTYDMLPWINCRGR
jgi:hypothetical protein